MYALEKHIQYFQGWKPAESLKLPLAGERMILTGAYRPEQYLYFLHI